MLGANQPFMTGGRQHPIKGGGLNDRFTGPDVWQDVNNMNNIKFN